MSSTRLFAPISAPHGQPVVRHVVGMPPEVTGEAVDLREGFAWPKVAIIEEDNDGLFLVRIADDGSAAGDTWHMNLTEAKEQAEYEFGEALGEWREVPANAKDAKAYALSQSHRA